MDFTIIEFHLVKMSFIGFHLIERFTLIERWTEVFADMQYIRHSIAVCVNKPYRMLTAIINWPVSIVHTGEKKGFKNLLAITYLRNGNDKTEWENNKQYANGRYKRNKRACRRKTMINRWQIQPKHVWRQTSKINIENVMLSEFSVKLDL